MLKDNTKRAPTIRDVARACGRSHMTVSNVLNNRHPVSETTRAEVLEAMRRLNFRPNAIARGLNRKPMNTLGVVLPNAFQAPTSHPYYSLVLDGVMEATVSLRMDVIVYTGSLWTENGNVLQQYRDGRSDGLVVVAPPPDSSLINSLIEAQTVFVGIGDYFSEPEVSCVCIDDVQSEMTVVDYLISLGHRRIAMLCGSDFARCVASRQEGFLKAMRKHGIPESHSLVMPGGFEEGTIRPRLEYLAAIPPSQRPTAIVTTNDQMALTVLSVLQRMGIKVPEQMSVIGFDDIRDAASVNLSTMRQPIRAIAYRAVQLLHDLLSGQITETIKEFQTPELVIRGSTAPPSS